MGDAFAPVTHRLQRYSTALRLTGADAATFERAAGPPLKNEVREAALAGFGSDLKPWKNKAVKAGFGYDTEATGTGLTIVLKLRPAGIWAFGEHGAGPHLIGAGRRRKAGGYGKGKFVKGAGYSHPVRGPILHPGTDGKAAIKYAFKRVRRSQRDAVKAGIIAVIESARHG